MDSRTQVRSALAALCVSLSVSSCALNERNQSASTMPISHSPTSPVRVVLVGDSTMAERTGYGNALCALFDSNVECVNLARGGRSSKSFRVEGLWDNALARLQTDQTTKRTYVLIQFGHNDQPGKAERSTDLTTEFPNNLTRYVQDSRAVGAIPVLVTPLTRRSFKAGVLQNDLRPWAEATLRVARGNAVQAIDLNAVSYAAVAALGAPEADTLAEEPPPSSPLPAGVKSRFDYTHVGAKGAAFFSRLMAKEIESQLPELARNLRGK